MPLYEYVCRDCDHRFEVLQRLGDGAEGLVCPSCGERRLVKQFSTFAGVTDGGGVSASAGGSGAAPGCGSGFT